METLAKQHNKLEQKCKVVDMRSKSLTGASAHPSQQICRSPGGTIDLEEEEEEDHDEFFDAMSEHPEAFGMGATADLSMNDPYSDNEDNNDNLSTDSTVAFASASDGTDGSVECQLKESQLHMRRSFSEKQLEVLTHQDLGHRRAVSVDLRGGGFGVSWSLLLSAEFIHTRSFPYNFRLIFHLCDLLKIGWRNVF